MKFPETQANESTKVELKQVLGERVNLDLLSTENAELKEALVKFAEDLATFQTLVNSTMSENKRQSLKAIEKHYEMLNEKISELLTSNQQLESSIASKIQGFTEKTISLVDNQKQRFDKMAQAMSAATHKYADNVKADLDEAHAEHTRYMSSLRGQNIAKGIYLAITPALVLFDLLSRFLGWF